MSRKQPNRIQIKQKSIEVNPGMIFESKIVKSGNGAVAKAYKRFIGKNCLIIIKEDNMDGVTDKVVKHWDKFDN